MDPDRRLVRFAKSGNTAAFGSLVRKYRDPVLSLAYDYLHDYELAKDVAQDTFVKAFRHINEFREQSFFSTWLYRIVVNTALDARKSQKRRKAERGLFKEKTAEPSVQAPAEPFLNLDDSVIQALNRLSENQYTVLVLRYFNDLSVREIAGILECSENTVRIHLHRAMQKLQAELRRGKKKR